VAGDGGSRLLGGLSGRLVFATLQPGSQLQWRRSLEQRRQRKLAAQLTAQRLQQLGACLGRTAWVRVTGYADPRYSAAYNKTLSERRARAVAGAISEGGFSSARITVVGAGKTSARTKVRVDKATLQRARRVDILVG